MRSPRGSFARSSSIVDRGGTVGRTCGIDWSEAQHDVAIVNDQGGIVARARVADDAAGFGQLLELLAEHGEDEPTRIEIAIETDKGLFVAALVTAGFTLFFD